MENQQFTIPRKSKHCLNLPLEKERGLKIYTCCLMTKHLHWILSNNEEQVFLIISPGA